MASLEKTTEHVGIEDLDQAWVTSLRNRVHLPSPPNQRRTEPPTIFKVPAIMREPDPHAYDPKLISLGPLHRHNPQLQPMNHLKLRYLRSILRRNPDAKLEDYLKLIKSLEPQSRSCYSTHIDMASNEFVELLLLDGCFIVQLLLMQYGSDSNGESEEEEEEDDPILSTTWTLTLIEYDMLMLENQIPFFILEKIFDLATDCQYSRRRSIVELVLDFFEDHSVALPLDEPAPKFHHILHLFHCAIMPNQLYGITPYRPNIYNKLDKATRLSARWLYGRVLSSFHIYPSMCRRGDDDDETAQRSGPPTPASVPCATRLKESGVRFGPNKGAKSFLDVTFEDGVMCFPTTLQVYNQTNSLFRNLIAFEQCYPRAGTHVAAYAVLMDCLIDTAEDVALLRRNQCIMNGLGNDDDAAVLFNRLCKEVAVDYDACYLAQLFKDVNRHCESRWNKWRATLMHDYFSTPWAFLSLAGALVLILLTVAQTMFSAVSYFWQIRHP